MGLYSQHRCLSFLVSFRFGLAVMVAVVVVVVVDTLLVHYQSNRFPCYYFLFNYYSYLYQ